MTNTNDKLRSLFLAALMVFSVFAGTVALTGTAAAAANVSIDDATEYTASGGTNTVEVVFSDPITNGIGDSDVDAEVDGTSIGASTVADATAGDQRVLLDIGQDVTPNQNLTVIVENRADGEGNTDETISAQDIDVTSKTITDAAGSAENRETVRHGETVAFVSGTTDDEVSFGSVAGETGQHSSVYTYDSTSLDSGSNYTAQFSDSSNKQYFRVASLGLSAEAVDRNITTDDALEVDVSINRPGSADVVLKDSNGENVDTQNDSALQGGKTTTFDFGTQDAGEYSVVVVDHDTGASAETDTYNVTDAADGDVDWEESDISEDQVGDVAEIPISLENTDEATIKIGGDDDGYTAFAEVTDGNDDGVVTLEFNSYAAGDSTDAEDDVLSVADSEDDLDLGSQTTDVDGPAAAGDSDLLDSGQYELGAEVGHTSGDFEADIAGTLSLQERSTENLTTHVVPAGASVSDDWDADTIAAAEGSNMTQSDEVAHGDYIVGKVSASGLSGLLAYEDTDLLADDVDGAANADGANVFADANIQNQIQLNVTQASPGQNQDAKELNINNSNTDVIVDADNDSYYFFVKSDEVEDMGDSALANGEEYEFQFGVQDDLLNSGDDKVVAGFEKAEQDVTLDTNDDDVVEIASSGGEITGTTNLAPGTSLDMKVSSQDQTSPFLTRPSADVQSNGSFSASVDVSDLAVGANLTVIVESNSDWEKDGVVVESTSTPTPEDNGTETPEDNGTETTESPTPDDSTEESTDETSGTEETTEGSGPGFTIVAALGALIAAALLAARRSN